MGRHRLALAVLVLLLSWVAGGVDAIGWLTLGHVYCAHMSGNTIGVMTHIVLGDWGETARFASAVAAFVVGLLAAAATEAMSGSNRLRLGLSIPLGTEAALLLGFLVGGRLVSHGSNSVPVHPASGYYPLVALAAASMGLQSATIRRAGPARVHTTFITGIFTHFGELAVQLAAQTWRVAQSAIDGKTGGAMRRETRVSGLLAGIVIAYAAGGFASGLVARVAGTWAVALPWGALLAATLVDAALAGTQDPDKRQPPRAREVNRVWGLDPYRARRSVAGSMTAARTSSTRGARV